MTQERWKELLAPHRFRQSRVKVTTQWNPFDSDYLRISLSAPFRRLQDKAQVFPLDNNDFVRTRLTHSIEVSGIGRSIGVQVENQLIEKGILPTTERGYIPSILAVCGLTHDIGNPPFGHFGEAIIQDFFKEFFSNTPCELTELQKKDLISFDGNVQSLRLLLKLGLTRDEFSFNLTYPSLATIIKYPKDSITGNKSKEVKEKALGVSFKKFGYFQAEKDKFESINSKLNLHNSRHPLCFLLEASDDICYSVSDLEDGVAKGIVTFSSLKSLLANENDVICTKLLCKIESLENELKGRANIKKLIAQEIRIAAQTDMINATISTFIENTNEILDCRFDKELLEASPARALRNVFSAIGIECFKHASVIKREILGDTVLKYLLKTFINASLSPSRKNEKTLEGKIYSLISSSFKYIAEKEPDDDTYSKLLMATDFISGMTDSFAVNLYNNLIGFELH